MSSVVLDASALLALLNKEKGHEIVEPLLPNAIMSTVNLSEVATVLSQIGISPEECRELTQSLIGDFVEFDLDQAYFAAQLRATTRDLGLSFGDRACLGLAHQLRLPVLTADRSWKQVSVGVEVRVIR